MTDNEKFQLEKELAVAKAVKEAVERTCFDVISKLTAILERVTEALEFQSNSLKAMDKASSLIHGTATHTTPWIIASPNAGSPYIAASGAYQVLSASTEWLPHPGSATTHSYVNSVMTDALKV
jgi:hypothetical protein